MKAKLTLNINTIVVDKAKNFALKNQTTISKLVEDFFITISKENSIVEDIIKNAPKKKTKTGNEKRILRKNLEKKFKH
ncbi:MAG: DUF6364 family protein [Ferruginibacter sp.]